MKKLYVVIDTQNDFMLEKGNLYVNGSEEMIPALREHLLGLSKEEVHSVIFTYDTHGEGYEDTPEGKMFPKHCVKGEDGWNNVFEDIFDKIEPEVVTLEKGVFNMWEEDNTVITEGFDDNVKCRWVRDYYFRNIKDEIEEVVIVGVASDFCVKWAVDGFLKRGFKIRVLSDFTRGINQTINEVMSDPEYVDVVVE